MLVGVAATEHLEAGTTGDGNDNENDNAYNTDNRRNYNSGVRNVKVSLEFNERDDVVR